MVRLPSFGGICGSRCALERSFLTLICVLSVAMACYQDGVASVDGQTEATAPLVPPASTPGDGEVDARESELADTRDFDSLAGQIVIDGSSTVFPITEEVSRQFRRLAPGVEVRLGVSGTGGGFDKFCRGLLDIALLCRRRMTADKVDIMRCDSRS